MSGYLLPTDSLPDFLDLLAKFGELHGSTLSDENVSVFARISSPGKLDLNYRRTLLGPKKYLLPPRDTVLVYSPAEGYQQSQPTRPDIVLFGLHPCDLAGIAYLDRAFTVAGVDQPYQSRRQQLTLIGLSCEPDEYCFCDNSIFANPTLFDLFLQRIPAGFHIITGSARGAAIIASTARLLTENESPPGTSIENKIAKRISEVVNSSETFAGSHLWDDFAARCLSCGACSICCPTCYCFDVREHGGLDGESAERIREWDNCLFPEFGKVAGGVTFRNDRRERFQYRYQHKYLGFGPLRGVASCVGCGRCREVCPVGIDLLDLFRESLHDHS